MLVNNKHTWKGFCQIRRPGVGYSR